MYPIDLLKKEQDKLRIERDGILGGSFRDEREKDSLSKQIKAIDDALHLLRHHEWKVRTYGGNKK